LAQCGRTRPVESRAQGHLGRFQIEAPGLALALKNDL
jgi:hypothetical protein